jgi:hypothetical protein
MPSPGNNTMFFFIENSGPTAFSCGARRSANVDYP